MTSHMASGHFPQYPHHDNLPDPEIRTLISNFYHASDQQDANELWISYFTEDAQVIMGSDVGKGHEEIRELRRQMWISVRDRKHTVRKVFPASFQSPEFDGPEECELMLFGEVDLGTKDGRALMTPWAGHVIMRKEKEGERKKWKFARYQVWLQET